MPEVAKDGNGNLDEHQGDQAQSTAHYFKVLSLKARAEREARAEHLLDQDFPQRRPVGRPAKFSTDEHRYSDANDLEHALAFRAAAELVVKDALKIIDQRLEAAGRPDLRHVPPQHAERVVGDVIEGYVKKPMGRKALARLALRRLSEDTLRTGVPNFSVKQGGSALQYFEDNYLSLFQLFGLEKKSARRVDANVYFHIKRTGDLKDLKV